MYKLYHYSLCPFSRMVRFVLNESGIDYVLVEEEFWNFNEKFLRINPMGTVPVLITEKNIVLNHHQLILEYIHANHNTDFLFPEGNDVLETKKICIWFNEKLFLDCTKFFMQEKVIRYLHEKTHPNANILSLARYNLTIHLDYISYLLDKSTWLAGERLSIADIAAVSQLSVLDFLGEIQWSKIPHIKDWYCIVKSRPAFRPFLKERIAGIYTPKHYSELDF